MSEINVKNDYLTHHHASVLTMLICHLLQNLLKYVVSFEVDVGVSLADLSLWASVLSVTSLWLPQGRHTNILHKLHVYHQLS